MSQRRTKELGNAGWREWVKLPDLGIPSIKAKLDTGARTSSLHAFQIKVFRRGEKRFARFIVQPEQRSKLHAIECVAPLIDKRPVRPSSGIAEVRHVVQTRVELLGERWEIEVTLTRRDAMGFRLLLGRQALRDRLLVDPGRSFVNGRRIKGSRRVRESSPRG